VQLQLSATAGADEITDLQVTLDDEPISAQLSGGRATLSLSGLSGPRHSLRAVAIDAAGRQSEPLYVPLWLDQGAADSDRAQWMSGPIYFAFLDRLANGDPANDDPTGASLPIGEYQGGDLRGLRNMLPYLDDLGVKTLWLSNPDDTDDKATKKAERGRLFAHRLGLLSARCPTGEALTAALDVELLPALCARDGARIAHGDADEAFRASAANICAVPLVDVAPSSSVIWRMVGGSPRA
jgi:hypothetical protein